MIAGLFGLRYSRGFTLIETMIALLVGAAVALLAHEIFRSAIDARQQLIVASADGEVRAEGRQWLSAAFRSTRVGADTPFIGHTDEVAFTTSVPSSTGRTEPIRATLHVGADGLKLDGWRGAPASLDPYATGLRIDYLLELGARAPWATEYISPVNVPLAVRLLVRRRAPAGERTDTLLFLVQGSL